MPSAPVRPLNPLAVILIAALAVAPILGAGLVTGGPIDAVPVVLVLLCGLTLAIAAAYAVDLLKLALVWLVLAAIFTGYFWRLELPGFFALTIDRVGIVVLGAVFLVAMAIGRGRFRWPGLIGWLVLALLFWVGLSAQLHGWTLPPILEEDPFVAPPYYRFIAGYIMPAAVFFVAVSAIRSDGQINAVLIFFLLFGIYLTVVGLAEYCHKHGLLPSVPWEMLIWPNYILDPNLGIHYARVRGPFLNSPDMGLSLVVCLFSNLLLASRVSPPRRVLVLLITLPIPLVTFFTLTRSIWVAGAVGVAIAIMFWPRSRRWAVAAGCLWLAAMALFVSLNWANLSSPHRQRGGLGDAPPVISRVEQAYITAELARENPFTGVGLGRYQIAAADSERLTAMGSRAMTYARGAVEHNNFLSLLAETGIPGMILYAALLGALLWVSIRLYRIIPPTSLGPLNRRFIVFFWIAWAGYFINAMFRQTTSSPFPNAMFLLLGGVMVGFYLQLSPQPLDLLPAAPRVARMPGRRRSARV